jgi:hypothetical protein
VPDLEVVVAEQVDRRWVVVELVDQHHVGIDPLDRLRDVAGLGVAGRGQVLDQLPGAGAVERRVERREAQGAVGAVPAVAVLHAAGRGGLPGESQAEGEDHGCGKDK